MRTRFKKIFFNIPLCILFVLLVFCYGQAQSGRRAPKPLSPPTVTQPSQESEQPPAPKPVSKTQTLIAGIEGSMDIPFYLSDAVWNGFIERFNKTSFIVISGDKNMSRKQASDRAKKETESPVVHLYLSTQAVGGSIGQISLDDLVVNFSIYSLGTGKVKERGRVYIRPNRSVLGQRLPSGRYEEAQMKEAGHEAADKVLALLHAGQDK